MLFLLRLWLLDMTFVEHYSYPPLIWATRISVQRRDEALIVFGELPFLDEQLQGAPDVLREYRYAGSLQRAQKGAGQHSPHIAFGNAQTDADLQCFIESYGPVVARSFCVVDVNER